jgi:hypothetical protein
VAVNLAFNEFNVFVNAAPKVHESFMRPWVGAPGYLWDSSWEASDDVTTLRALVVELLLQERRQRRSAAGMIAVCVSACRVNTVCLNSSSFEIWIPHASVPANSAMTLQTYLTARLVRALAPTCPASAVAAVGHAGPPGSGLDDKMPAITARSGERSQGPVCHRDGREPWGPTGGACLT